MSKADYVVVRQQAGAFVKAYATDRAGFVRWNRGRLPGETRSRCGPALCRTSRDKLEVRLALFGYEGIFYSLTFTPENSPGSWAETKTRWDAFVKKLKRFRARSNAEWPRLKLPMEFDYVYRIEHRHDNWHLHCFLRESDFPPAVVRYLWDYGIAEDAPWTYRRVHDEGGYRGLAEYFTKEVPDVGRHPWGTNRGLTRLIPEPKISFSSTGRIAIPKGSVLLPVKDPGMTPWGVFQYCRYLTSGK